MKQRSSPVLSLDLYAAIVMTKGNPGLIDGLDITLIELLATEPSVGVLEASRRLRVYVQK